MDIALGAFFNALLRRARLNGTLTLPGLIDAHVHLREPGATHKEDCRTGTAAALAGGFNTILDMPNNQPPLTNLEVLRCKQALFSTKALCDYGLFAGYDPRQPQALTALAPYVVGLKLYLDTTFASAALTSEALDAVFRDWPGPGPIAIHAESCSIPLALELAARHHQRLHVCHVPQPDDLLVIDRARQAGTQVTCEVTPHHLLLTTEDERRLGAFGRMKPPLLAPNLVDLLWQRLALVDIIASDHAPHTIAEKTGPEPAPGVPGLETTLPLMLQAVDEGRLSLDRLLELLHHAPARIYGLPFDSGQVEIELTSYTLPAAGYHTRCGWTPFAGKRALGIIRQVTLRSTVVYNDNQVLVRPGFGRNVVHN
ncbi:MAG: amidohydrolase family protein [Chloroflexi bacterium]|nr:amidohydrolase family protein [Chloroflexota bacterium]